MNLVVDIGNTFVKAAIFNHKNERIEKFQLNHQDLPAFCADHQNANNWIISSVKTKTDNLVDKFNNWGLVLAANTPLPFNSKYATPATIGLDRLAAVAGGLQFLTSKKQALLCIDIGTCITYEAMDANRNYLGGSISPGETLRIQSMHNFTENLPLLEKIGTPPLIGDSTQTCMQSGVYHGIMAEIKEIIRMYESKFAHLQIIICGGGSEKYYLKQNNVLKVPDLVLYGLNGILKHNVR